MLGTIVSVATMLAVAHLGGVVARPLGQPAVIGQLLAGVAIGPTVLGSRSDDLLSEDTLRAVRDLGTLGLGGVRVPARRTARPSAPAAAASLRGLLGDTLYAVLVIMAVVTMVATSPSLRLLGFRRA